MGLTPTSAMSRSTARRAVLCLTGMLGFVGLWLLLVPFYGASGSERSTLTAVLVRHGGRTRCPSIATLDASDPQNLGRDYDKQACYAVAVDREEHGWMLVFTSAFGSALALVLLRDGSGDTTSISERWRKRRLS